MIEISRIKLRSGALYVNYLQLEYCPFLIHIMPQVSFYAPWNFQKTRVFLTFLGGCIEGDQWRQME